MYLYEKQKGSEKSIPHETTRRRRAQASYNQNINFYNYFQKEVIHHGFPMKTMGMKNK